MKKQKSGNLRFDNRSVGFERSSVVSALIEEQLFAMTKGESDSKTISSVHAGKINECSRRIGFLLYNLHEDASDPVGMIHMKMGIRWHEFLQETMQASGKAKAVEKKMPRLANIAGMLDLLIDDGNAVVPIEIKPMSKDRFQSATEPDANHVAQLQMYMHWSNAKYGYLFYYCKNITHWRQDVYHRLPFLEFKIAYNPQLIEDFKKKSERIFEYVDAGSLPPIPVEFGPSYCKYCPFYPAKCIEGMDYVNRRLKELKKGAKKK